MFYCFIALLIPSFSQATVQTEALAKKVIELRQEVEILNDDYKTEREKVVGELKGLSIQKAELDSNVRNEEIRKKQLQEKLAKLKKEINDSSIESKELKPVVEQTIALLRSYITASLPFKKNERLQSLHRLAEKLEKNEISAVKASNQLWSMIEDERRLARETSLQKQTIVMGKKMKLAEVVKVGMMFLYFKTADGQVGMAKKQGDAWIYHAFQNESKEHQTLAFFESLKKQIRQGYFEIPTEI